MSPRRPELAVGAIVVEAGSLLMVRRARAPGAGRWSVPGGRVEAGERVSDAVAREVSEETGVAVVPGELAGWVERIDGDHHFVILDFFASPRTSGSPPVAGDDAADARWVPTGEIAALDLVEGLLAFLEAVGIVAP